MQFLPAITAAVTPASFDSTNFFKIQFPATPEVTSVTGCSPSVVSNITVDCPTEGNVTLTMTGINLFAVRTGAANKHAARVPSFAFIFVL
jgi:hypothetical protein